jgi:hypothetical protein
VHAYGDGRRCWKANVVQIDSIGGRCIAKTVNINDRNGICRDVNWFSGTESRTVRDRTNRLAFGTSGPNSPNDHVLTRRTESLGPSCYGRSLVDHCCRTYSMSTI